jgi:hypothetical protein
MMANSPRKRRDRVFRGPLRWALMVLVVLSSLVPAAPIFVLPALGMGLPAPFASAQAAAYGGAPQFQQDCTDLVQNGGFEQDAAWQRPRTALGARYVGQGGFPQGGTPHSGQRAIRLGTLTATSHASYSSVRQQIHVPTTANVVTLEFWVWMFSQDADGGDRQEAYLLNPDTGGIMVRVWRVDPAQNVPNWQVVRADLTPYRGQDVLLYFNVYNDGDDKPTALFLDDVHVLACAALRPTPTATPFPSPTTTAMTVTVSIPVPTPTPTLIKSPLQGPPTLTRKAQPAVGVVRPTPTQGTGRTPTPTSSLPKMPFGFDPQVFLVVLYTFGFTFGFLMIAVWVARTLRKRLAGRP